jgi:uncharacterized membrane protein YqjE
MNDNPPAHDPNALHGSIGDLLDKIASDSAALVREEVSLAKREIAQRMVSLQSGLIMLGAGLVFGIIALMTFCGAMIIAISTVTGPGIAAFVIGVLLAIIAVIAALMGLAHIRKVT